MIHWLFLLILTLPKDGVLNDQVDVIEINHLCDDKAEPVFDQWIAWNWSPIYSKYEVVAWRMLKGVRSPKKQWRGGHAVPIYRYDRGLWVSRWKDEGVWREVTALMFRETWTQHDPEVEQRSWLPENCRVGLSARRKAK